MKLVTPEQQKREREKVAPKRKPRFTNPKFRYIVLTCDHVTTPETQEVYSAFRTSPELYFCEICGLEVSGRPAKEYPPQPDEPPF